MTSQDVEKTGMSLHGADPCLSPSIAGWAFWDLRDPTLDAYRTVTRLVFRGQVSRHSAEAVTSICPFVISRHAASNGLQGEVRMAISKSPHVWRMGPGVTEGRWVPMECSGADMCSCQVLAMFLVRN